MHLIDCFQASRDRQSLIPVSVKQVITCSQDEDTIRIDGAELNLIKLMGMVDNITDHETNSTFKLSDGSGTIDCKQFRDKGANNASKPSKLKYVHHFVNLFTLIISISVLVV